MTWDELVRTIATRTLVPAPTVRAVLAEAFDPIHGPIVEAATIGEEVRAPGFGTFRRVARTCHPGGAEEHTIVTLSLRPSTTLRAAMRGEGTC